MNLQSRLLQLVFACSLGAILTLAFAPYGVFPLAIFVMMGLLSLCFDKSPRYGFWLGFLFGLGFFGFGVYWIFISIHIFGDIPNILAITLTGTFISFLALFPASVCYFTLRYFPLTTTSNIICGFPAIWVISEWIRSWLLTGFPWLFLGYSQIDSPLSGFASLFSVYGVSFATVLSASLLFDSFIKLRAKNFSSLYKNLFIVSCIWLMGGLITLIPWTKTIAPPIKISLIQGNIPQSIKWVPENLQLSLDTYQNLTNSLWNKGKLIIWPEAAIPNTLQNSKEYLDNLDQLALKNKSTIILGIPIFLPKNQGFYNSIISLGKDKRVYLKRRLVPFGEYTPFESILGKVLNYFNIEAPNLMPGDVNQPPMQIEGFKILPTICYEIAFPELIKSQDKNINLLLTLTNDAWFGKSNAQAQHLEMARMRALEFNRPLIFVSNDGITAIINPNGKINAAAPSHTQYVLNGQVQPVSGITPWMRNGMDPLLFLLICSLAIGIRYQKKNRIMPLVLDPNTTT